MAHPGWRNVLLLAGVSLVADVSGEMLMAVLPFVLVAQGATGVGLGLVSGVSEGFGHVMKLAGGYLGQRAKRRIPLVGAGYLLAALSRFGVALATAWPLTMAFRSLDRVGKGLRTAPRDAVITESIPESHWGQAFGLHRAADTAGAVIGVLAVLALMSWTGASESTIILIGAVVGLFTVVPLLFIHEPEAAPAGATDAALVTPRPSQSYLAFLAVVALFNLGRISYLFFLLRAASGSTITAAVGWYLAFNVVYMAAAYPLGRWADAIGTERIYTAGIVLTAAAAACFVPTPSPVLLAAGFALLGLAFAASEGSGRVLASRLAGAHRRSSRLGEYHAVAGAATLAGGLAAGILWDQAGHSWAFGWGVALPILALAMLAGLALSRPGRFAPP
ncbi:MAG: MFS transporter [Thermoplasmatota archaeon]